MGEAGRPSVGVAGSSTVAERLARRADGKTRVEAVRTPYGSVDVLTGSIGGGRFAAVGKSLAAPFPPHHLPYRATLLALAKVGCERILSTSVATSLDERLRLGDCFVPDDFLDVTGRSVTFFDGGLEGTHHADMAAPFCRRLSREFTSSARSFGLRVMHGGAIATVPGPHHPSPAEAAHLAGLGAVAASFSASTEAKLARELGVCFVTAAVAVRTAAPQAPWRAGPKGELPEPPTDAELLKAFSRGEEPASRAARTPETRDHLRGRGARKPESREAREMAALKAKLLDADKRMEEAAAGFIPHAAALAPCPHCPKGAGPVPR